jgi:hypothetical protein
MHAECSLEGLKEEEPLKKPKTGWEKTLKWILGQQNGTALNQFKTWTSG